MAGEKRTRTIKPTIVNVITSKVDPDFLAVVRHVDGATLANIQADGHSIGDLSFKQSELQYSYGTSIAEAAE